MNTRIEAQRAFAYNMSQFIEQAGTLHSERCNALIAESVHNLQLFQYRVGIQQRVSLAMTAPSACNRQHARVHIIDDVTLRDKLFSMQQGTRGFGTDADKVMVVIADLSAIRRSLERHAVYVNGGIFVMNLCNALHYEVIAYCIFHWSVPPEVNCTAHKLLSISNNEVIVPVLAYGIPTEEYDVAASPRRDVHEILTWHRAPMEELR